jgi:alkaline phosphatase
VVSNGPIADATPAACYAHVPDRGDTGAIVAQLFAPRAGDGVDVVVGAGRRRHELPDRLESVPRGARRLIVLVDGDLDRVIERTARSVSERDTLVVFSADLSFDVRVRGGKKGESLLAHPGAPEPPLRVEDDHTGEEVVVAARGPGAERVRGFFPNTPLFEIMMAAYGWKPDPAPREGGR